MTAIYFEIQGKRVTPDSMKDALDYAYLKHIRESIKKCTGSLRCHEHGKRPIVKVRGEDTNSLTYEISGCCNDFIEKVQINLK
jgi:hypothetical protein